MPGGGSKPGERRGGRKKGTPNKATAEVKDIASQWGPAAIRRAAEMAGLVKGKPAAASEQAQAHCLNIILDRAYGKAMQPITGDMTYGISEQLAEMFRASGTDGALGSEIARRAANGQQRHH
jgi:hypothetical protein